jgi:general stress protein YciG
MAKAESESNNATGREKEQLTVTQAGQRGGCATRDRHGVEFLRKIAQKGGRTTATRYHNLLSEFGKRGGRPRRPALNEDLGEKLPEKKEDEMRSVPGSPSPT